VRYLGQLGGALGVAIIGTVVNNSLSDGLASRIPASTAEQLTPGGYAAATNPQVLVNPAYHDTVIHTAQQYAVQQATASVPPGSQHDAIVASITAQVNQQVLDLLTQVFSALKDSLAFAIQQGFLAVLVFSGLCLLATLFLKDVPFKQWNGDVEREPSRP
jgi:hypothetical protein